MLKKIIVMVVLAVSAFAMHNAQININDRDLEVGAQFDVGQFNKAVDTESMFVGAKFLNASNEYSLDNDRDVYPYFEGSFLMMREVGKLGMSFGMGIKVNFTKVGNDDFSSLPLGVEFAYVIPAPDLVPMSLHGSLYYAPQVLSFIEAKEYLEYRIHYDVELIKNAGITVGYRSSHMMFKDETERVTYNAAWFFGFKVKF